MKATRSNSEILSQLKALGMTSLFLKSDTGKWQRSVKDLLAPNCEFLLDKELKKK